MTAMTGSEMIRELQERAARALPAERVEDAEGWWLRHAPRCAAWWVGSVLPHGAVGPDELVYRVSGAERFYAEHGAVARFQISPGACPAGLDPLLAERGYRRESPMSLRVAPTARVLEWLPAGPLRVVVDDGPTRRWFDAWYAVHGRGGDPRAEWDVLDRVERPSGYARAMLGDDVVAVGRVVADTGWAGMFGMATRPAARGRGAARSVLAALARWAGDQRADHVYLQVEPDNAPALWLYERAGFAEICAYHYRTAR
ncbi:Acetyltransferase (GNAT) family protein [Amycolatopsis arida]|uniref:Acetyltransferase (GNAT) family protein n=1 Tax=Amycolatopsis arida TaxID=587909 RepID=A0A1I5K5N6_9PSEU|nr:GNAT family N-acetyltransferase [Amycolatopsis arida]TDX96899.1 acetyltransferase (GNAT) family protein [Amycolatopsis arida]SFO80424.1 Acetyltransferase (GNAT) family protein [Amycolatopsis arida]